MIVHYLNARWARRAFRTFKANSPLLIDANRILAGSVALKGFQAIAREPGQIKQTHGGVKNFEPLPSLPVKALERADEPPFAKTSVCLFLKLKIIDFSN